jgi:hypothetical protein
MPTTDTNWTWAWPWWGTLVAINVINVIICIVLFIRSKKDKNPAAANYLLLMRTMGLIFVAVAFYRSIFVSGYMRQLAWFDSVLNSSLLIRGFAIFAELCFAGLIAKGLLRMNEDIPGLIDKKNKFQTFLQTKTPIILFVCIFIANIFVTAATITKIDLLFALEETFWGIGFVCIIPMLIISLRKLFMYRNTPAWVNTRQVRVMVILITTYCIAYSLLQFGFFLPLVYWPSAIAQLQMPNPDPAFRFGFQAILDALLIVRETKDLDTWGGMGFIIWHTTYFSICVWFVLFLMTGPRMLNIAKATTKK